MTGSVHLAKQIVLILSMTFLFKYVNTDTTMACIMFCLLICSLYRYSWKIAELQLNNNHSSTEIIKYNLRVLHDNSGHSS
jgi:hypothetical protein